MRVRNISDDPRIVPCLGRAIEVDEVVTVPPALEGQEWDIPGVFEVVADTKPSKPITEGN